MSTPTSTRVDLVVSPHASARLAAASEWLGRLPAEGPALLVADNVDSLAELVRARVAAQGSVFGWRRLTLGQLAEWLALPQLAAEGLTRAGGLVCQALCARVVYRSRGRLGRFEAVADRPGLPRSLFATFEELRLEGVTPEQLPPRSQDLAALYAAYLDALADQRLADRAATFEAAISALRQRLRREPPRPALLLDVSLDSRVEATLAGVLCQQADPVLVTLPRADTRSQARLEAAVAGPLAARSVRIPLATALDRLRAHLFVEGGDTSADGPAVAAQGDEAPEDTTDFGWSEGGRARRGRLDRSRAEPGERSESRREASPALPVREGGTPHKQLDESVVLLAAAGVSRECVEIARRMLAEANAGVSFDAMAVWLRDPGRYVPALTEALRRARIPVHLANGARLPDPTGRAFSALLSCAADNLSVARFAEYLSLGQLPRADANGAPPEALDALARWTPPDLAEPDERGGEGPFAGRDETAETDDGPESPGAEAGPQRGGEPTASETVAVGAQGERGPPIVAGTLRSPRRWEQLLVDAAVIRGRARWERRLGGLERELDGQLARLEPTSAHAAAVARKLVGLGHLRRFALPLLDQLEALPRQAPWGVWIDRLGALATRALRRPRRVLAVLAELTPMASIPANLDEVRRVLEPRLNSIRAEPLHSPYGRVFVGPVWAARGHAFEVVFVPGLAERRFPSRIVEDTILLDRDRQLVSAGLVTNRDRVARERLALRLAVGSARRRLVLSYPRMDAERARPSVPSFYCLEVLRVVDNALPSHAALARRAAEAAAAPRLAWPAPRSAEDAIDESEYDLAVLEAALRRRAESPPAGAAHYLIGASPFLARTLRARFARWQIGAWKRADGLVMESSSPPLARQALARHQLAERAFSPTALQAYSHCPYRFYLKAVLRLAPREVPEAIETMSPRQRGSLFHDAQFQLLSWLRDSELLPVTAERLPSALQQLDWVLDQVEARYREELAPAIERIWRDGVEAIRRDLRTWLSRMPEDPTWMPWRFELGFGLRRRPGSDPHSVEAPVELDSGLMLRGLIDLVERAVEPAPDDDTRPRLRATDHKTGRARVSHGVVEGGATLQPVLYPLAIEKLFPGARVESGGLYYCTSRGRFREHRVRLDERARDAAGELAREIGGALAAGFLPATPQKDACVFCDYLPVCGPHEERRVTRKRAIDGLARLRSLP